MTAIPPWIRGYRRALRDVQYGIAQHAHSIKEDEHKRRICFSITMEFAIHLGDLKREESEFLQLVHQKEDGFRHDVSADLPSSEILPRVLFEDGYLSGFADAIIITQDYKASMNDPVAHTAISPLIARLETVQTHFKETTGGKLVTLKRCKYVI